VLKRKRIEGNNGAEMFYGQSGIFPPNQPTIVEEPRIVYRNCIHSIAATLSCNTCAYSSAHSLGTTTVYASLHVASHLKHHRQAQPYL
jgi:hypothetical protein